MKNITRSVVGLAAGALLLAGCQTEASSPNRLDVRGTSQVQLSEENERLTLEEAKDIAFDHAEVDASGAVFDDEEYDSEDQKYELEFVVDNIEYEYDINAYTGDIIKVEREVKVKTEQANESETIGLDEAKSIALDYIDVSENEVKWDEQKLDKEDYYYELEFYVNNKEFEFEIDAYSGEILEFEQEQEKKTSQKSNNQSQSEQKQEEKSEPEQTEQNQSESDSQSNESTSNGDISKDRAIDIALEHAGLSRSDVQFDEVEWDTDDGIAYWEIEFYAGNYEYEYDVLVSNGSIKDMEREKHDRYKAEVEQKVYESKSDSNQSELSQDEAVNIAMNHAGLSRSDVVFDDIELDTDDGITYWEIEFDYGQKEYEYEIHTRTGKILDFEVEYDD